MAEGDILDYLDDGEIEATRKAHNESIEKYMSEDFKSELRTFE